jgi:hypothetical protein
VTLPISEAAQRCIDQTFPDGGIEEILVEFGVTSKALTEEVGTFSL